MKILIEKTPLEDALKNLIAFTDKKDLANITSHVFMEANAGILRFEANDLEMGLSLRLETEVVEPGSATLNAKHFLDIVSKLEPGQLALESKEDFVHVSFKRSKFKLPLFDQANFPPFPTCEQLPLIHFSDTALGDHFKKLLNVIKTNASKYEFGGALLVFKDRLELVATDAARLSLVQINPDHMPEPTTPVQEFILPKRAMLEIVKLFESDFDMFYEPNMLFFKNDSLLLYSKLISGKYPNYQNIIPKTFAHKLELETQSFKEAIKITNALGTTTKIIFYPDRVEFESLHTESSSFASTSIEANTPLDNFVLKAYARHLLDALNALSAPTFNLLLNESSQPFLVEKEGFKTIIMPVLA